MKTCFKCGATRPLSEFYKHPQMADGHVNKCKECNKVDVRLSYAARPVEERKAYERSRLNDPKRVTARKVYQKRMDPARVRGYKEKWAARNQYKRKAQHTLGNAIRDGKIQRQACERCGSLRSQGHHEDYSKPLEVIWLCPKHHGERHRELRDMGIQL